MKIVLRDKETGREFSFNEIMEMGSLEVGCDIEGYGIQEDGAPVLFDKCGNFEYLDPSHVIVSIEMDE